MAEHYPGQAEDETTKFVIYKHWFSIMPFLFVVLIIFVLAITAIYYGSSNNYTDLFQNVSSSVVIMFGISGIFVGIFFFAAIIWIWRQNHVIVTDEHVVDIAQTGLFGRRVSIVNLGSIQDVSTEVNGPMQTILHFGTITLQTAGEKEEFLLTYMPDPYNNERRIHEIHRKYRLESGEVETSPPTDPPARRSPKSHKPHATNPLEK